MSARGESGKSAPGRFVLRETLDPLAASALHPPVNDKRAPSDPRARREAELAEALRANLRRRKAAAEEAPRGEAKEDGKEDGERSDPPLPPSRGRV
jgi:hypothetical protein